MSGGLTQSCVFTLIVHLRLFGNTRNVTISCRPQQFNFVVPQTKEGLEMLLRVAEII